MAKCKQVISKCSVQFSSIQSLSHVRLFVTPWTAACQASLSITNSQSLLKLISFELVIPSNHLILVFPFSSRLQPFPAWGSFPTSQFFASGSQSIGVSASASVLPMNIQDWFPLGWTGWISLLSKGLSRVFSSTTIQKHQFWGIQPSSWSNSRIHIWWLEKPSFDYGPLLAKCYLCFLIRCRTRLSSSSSKLWLSPFSAVKLYLFFFTSLFSVNGYPLFPQLWSPLLGTHRYTFPVLLCIAILRSGDAVIQGVWMHNFYQTKPYCFFQSDCNLFNFIIFNWSKWLFWFIFSATMFQRSYWSTFSLILYIIKLLCFQLNWCRVSSHFAQIYIFLITKKAAKLPMCLLARHVLFWFCSSFREWSVNVFCPLLH